MAVLMLTSLFEIRWHDSADRVAETDRIKILFGHLAEGFKSVLMLCLPILLNN